MQTAWTQSEKGERKGKNLIDLPAGKRENASDHKKECVSCAE